MKSDKSDFTQGSIPKKLALFMLPILGALVLQAAYGAVDLLVVGRFGTTAGLSAVSTGSQVLNLVTFVVTQFAMGITVLIARYLGEKHPEYIGQVIGGGTVVFAIIAAALFVEMVGFARGISILMQAPAEAVELTASYVRICGAGIFFIVAYNVLSAIFRGLGDSKSPLIFVLVACIVNIFGDLLLVAGFHMDAAGAAIATVAAQAVSVVCAVAMLLKKHALPRTGVIHGFAGSLQQAERFVQLGYKIGVGGTITYPRASKTREVMARLPLSALLLETDAPDMPLNGFQGQPNRPEQAARVFEALCELRPESPAAIEEGIMHNTLALFSLPPVSVW